MSKLKNQRNEDLKNAFDNVISELAVFEPKQKAYKMDLRRVVQRAEKIKKDAVIAKDQKNQVVNFYTQGFLFGWYNSLTKQLEQTSQFIKQCEQNSSILSSLHFNFMNQVFNYRKALFNARYQILDRFKNICQQGRSGIATLFVVLYENVKRGKTIFKRDMSGNQWNYLRGSRMRYEKTLADFEKSKTDLKQLNKNTQNLVYDINKVTGQYNKTLNQLIKFVGMFMQALTDISMGFKLVTQKYKKIILQGVSSTFDLAQSPLVWIRPTMEIFEQVINKFVQIAYKIRQPQNQLLAFSQRLKQHIQISLSLLQSNNPSLSPQQRISYHTSQLQKLINNSDLQIILRKMLEIIESKLAQTVQLLQSKTPQKRKRVLDNSMDISMLSEYEEIAFQRQTSRDEMWLHIDWKDTTGYRLHNLDQTKAAVEAIKVPPPPEDKGTQLESHQCTLISKNYKGNLSIRDKDITFSTGQITVKIPYSDIDSVTGKTKIFVGQFLTIVTNKGQIVFSGMASAEKCKNRIVGLQSGGENEGDNGAAADQPQLKRVKVQLEAQQLAAIEARKAKIKGQLIDYSKMMQLCPTVTYKQIGIDDFYQQIYSDTPKVIKGRRWDCTTIYILHQSGSNNKIKATPYNSPGPKFYSLKQDITFENCPLFSQRQLQYDHDIPKLPIPFMPKFVHCVQMQRIYWISHEQFHYYSETRSSGAPYTTSFFVKLMHTVRKKDNNIQVDYYAIVHFVEDVSFKNMLKEKAQNETKENLAKSIKVYNERVEAFKNSGGKQQVAAPSLEGIIAGGSQQANSDKTNLVKQLQQIKKQKNIILAVSIGALLFSIILRFI